MRVYELLRRGLGIVLALIVTAAIIAMAVVAIRSMDFAGRTWQNIKAPFTSVFGPSRRQHDLTTDVKTQLSRSEVIDLATIMAYDSRGEIAHLRPEVMRQIGLVVLRNRTLAKKDDPKAPERSVSAILAGADTWLPEKDWDPREESRCRWYDREPERMLKQLSQGELLDARKIAEDIIKTDPGEGSIRYTRPPAPTYRQRAVELCSNERGAAKRITETMDLDPSLEKPGIKTHFYRRRPTGGK